MVLAVVGKGFCETSVASVSFVTLIAETCWLQLLLLSGRVLQSTATVLQSTSRSVEFSSLNDARRRSAYMPNMFGRRWLREDVPTLRALDACGLCSCIPDA